MKPIAVVGCPRSGSTLLASLLGGHSEIVSPPESQFLLDLAERFEPDARVAPAAVWSFIADHWRFRIWGEPMPEPPAWSCDRVPVREVAQAFLAGYARARGKPDARFWVEQSPEKAHRLLAFERMFGAGTVLHIHRDGRAVAASLLAVDWGPDDVFTAADYWLRHVGLGELAVAAAGPRGSTLRYEDLVDAPEATLRRALAPLGAAFEPAMLEGRGVNLPAYTTGQHALVGGGVERSRLERWRELLTPRQIALFEYTVGDVLDRLGYAAPPPTARCTPRRGERRRHELAGAWRHWRNKLRRRARIAAGLRHRPSGGPHGRRG